MDRRRVNTRSLGWLLLLAVGLFAGAGVGAVTTAPTPDDIAWAIERGVAAKDRPESLFKEYEFGERGIAVNGMVLTKLFQVSHRAAMRAAAGEENPPSAFADILERRYLMIQLYLPAASEADLQTVSVALRQGIKTLPTAELLLDPVEKVLCREDVCLYKRDVYAAFWEGDFDPARLGVLAISYGGQTVDFALQFGTFR